MSEKPGGSKESESEEATEGGSVESSNNFDEANVGGPGTTDHGGVILIALDTNDIVCALPFTRTLRIVVFPGGAPSTAAEPFEGAGFV